MNALESQLLTGAVAGLVAALVTSYLSLRGVKLSLKQAREGDRLADARLLRDDRRERLRAAIETSLLASLALAQVVLESSAIWQSETLEARNQRHEKMIAENWVGLNKARVSLMVQADGKDLVKLLDDTVFNAYKRYMTRMTMNVEHPGTVPYEELAREGKQMLDGIEEFRAGAQRLLDEMEKPI